MIIHFPDRSASNALLVGAATFTNAGITDLPAVANNITSLAEALTDPTNGVIDASRCQTMINPRTQAEFGAALDQAVHAATDTVIVYYAGHGLLTHHGVLHLALADTKLNLSGTGRAHARRNRSRA